MAYTVTIHTGMTGQSFTVNDRGSLGLVLDQLKNPDGLIALNPGAGDQFGEEAYIPVRAVTTVLVTKQSR